MIINNVFQHIDKVQYYLRKIHFEMIINNVYQHIDINCRVYQLPTLSNVSNKGIHNIDNILSNTEMLLVLIRCPQL